MYFCHKKMVGTKYFVLNSRPIVIVENFISTAWIRISILYNQSQLHMGKQLFTIPVYIALFPLSFWHLTSLLPSNVSVEYVRVNRDAGEVTYYNLRTLSKCLFKIEMCQN